MLFFLKYTKSEDLKLTHAEFRKQAVTLAERMLPYSRSFRLCCELCQVTSRHIISHNMIADHAMWLLF